MAGRLDMLRLLGMRLWRVTKRLGTVRIEKKADVLTLSIAVAVLLMTGVQLHGVMQAQKAARETAILELAFRFLSHADSDVRRWAADVFADASPVEMDEGQQRAIRSGGFDVLGDDHRLDRMMYRMDVIHRNYETWHASWAIEIASRDRGWEVTEADQFRRSFGEAILRDLREVAQDIASIPESALVSSDLPKTVSKHSYLMLSSLISASIHLGLGDSEAAIESAEELLGHWDRLNEQALHAPERAKAVGLNYEVYKEDVESHRREGKWMAEKAIVIRFASNDPSVSEDNACEAAIYCSLDQGFPFRIIDDQVLCRSNRFHRLQSCLQ